MDDDHGLFGPGSVTWKIHSEPILTVGGLRALFLQSLHPRAMAGVAQNSDYRVRPWYRLARTSTYITTVIWAPTAQVEAAGRQVREIHSRLRGTDLRTGEQFRIDEPDLLRWIHVCEVESFLDVARRAGVALTDAEVDTYYREQLRSAEQVGLDPATVPDSAAAIADYYDRMQDELAITREAAEAAVFLLAPPMPFGLGYTPLRGVYFGVAALAVGLLPAWARRRYGLPGLPVADPAASLSARMLRLSLMAIPPKLLMNPARRAALGRLAAAD